MKKKVKRDGMESKSSEKDPRFGYQTYPPPPVAYNPMSNINAITMSYPPSLAPPINYAYPYPPKPQYPVPYFDNQAPAVYPRP